ncbi:hypothetical protein, partial [Anabaena sp. CCY 9910]|uniref:hypothetical protein n=1 Tax=Anabaena sp. CCY 9910 TaxID=3103870 RepID=UPI0039E085C4
SIKLYLAKSIHPLIQQRPKYQGCSGLTNATNHLCKSIALGNLIFSSGLNLLWSSICLVNANPQFQA